MQMFYINFILAVMILLLYILDISQFSIYAFGEEKGKNDRIED